MIIFSLSQSQWYTVPWSMLKLRICLWEITMDTFSSVSIIVQDDSFVSEIWSLCLLWFHPVISSLSHLLFVLQDSVPNVRSIPSLGQRLSWDLSRPYMSNRIYPHLVHTWATDNILMFHTTSPCFMNSGLYLVHTWTTGYILMTVPYNISLLYEFTASSNRTCDIMHRSNLYIIIGNHSYHCRNYFCNDSYDYQWWCKG